MQTRGHTKLRKYVTDGNNRQYEFAEALRTTPANVSRWLSGKAKPLDEMKRRIEAATDGAVPASDWLVPESADQSGEAAA